MVRLTFFTVFALILFSARLMAAMPDNIPTSERLAVALFHFHVLTPDDPLVVDEYMCLTECDIYQKYYSNDFEWRSIRSTMRKTIIEQTAAFDPTFYILGSMILGRYDFDHEAFDIDPKTSLERIGSIVLVKQDKNACGVELANFPQSYKAKLTRSINLTEIPMDKDSARDFVSRLSKGDGERVIYLKIGITLLDAGRVESSYSGFDLSRPFNRNSKDVWFKTRPDHIEVYADKALEELIYSMTFDDKPKDDGMSVIEE
ncbi:MAG: DUF4852 domain-containing protein [Pseudomonadota bacterium]|nr:DUF4852 domain-containing protein [Pseudomonadota bacterium]